VSILASVAAGFHFAGLGIIWIAATALLLLTVFYNWIRPAPSITCLTMGAAAWVVFTASGLVTTYLSALSPRPLLDLGFTHADAVLGFDWPTWTRWVWSHPGLTSVLHVVYASLIPQILLVVTVLPHLAPAGRHAELLLRMVVALALTNVLFFLFPAAGAFSHFGMAHTPADLLPSKALYAIRNHGRLFNFGDAQGIISFPSFHTVMALLLTATWRGVKRMFWPVAVLNGLMLLSVPSEGGHYMTDMLGGFLVAGVACLVVRWLLGHRHA
jgi:membrane-associated phospholipid phosphatase